MKDYQIISDSSCDIPPELLTTLGVGIVPYSVSFDTVNYHKEYVELTPDDFYEKIADSSVFPKTSLPPIQDYIDVFEPYLKQDMDIFCICLSSKFSGSFQSATNAKSILEETYPHRKIEIFDSLSATGGQGLMVYEAVCMQKKGFSLEDLCSSLTRLQSTSKINFTVDSLEHLQKGGRVGKASALAGTILNIKPIIVLTGGELLPESKVRGHKKALRTIMDMTRKEIGHEKENYRVLLLRGAKEREDAALALAEELRSEGFDVMNDVWTVGVTIGTHAGPTAIGISYMKKQDYPNAIEK